MITIKSSPKNKKPEKISSTSEDDENEIFILKPKKEVKKPEFFVSDEFGNFFSGYRNGLPYWSDKISEARELTEETHFNSLVRWEKNFRNLKKEFI